MMTTRLIATLVLLHTWLTDPTRERDERGSVSTEQALWAGAVVLLASIVIAALMAFVQGKLGALA